MRILFVNSMLFIIYYILKPIKSLTNCYRNNLLFTTDMKITFANDSGCFSCFCNNNGKWIYEYHGDCTTIDCKKNGQMEFLCCKELECQGI